MTGTYMLDLMKYENVKITNIFTPFSLCTTLCLQWEPEIIAIALMYLAGKLSKFEITDWIGRQPRHLRWWDMFVEDISLEILEGMIFFILSYNLFIEYVKGFLKN